MIGLVALLVFATVLLIVHGYVMSEMFTDSRLFWSIVGAK